MLDNDGKKFPETTFRNRVFNLTSCHSQASLPSIRAFTNYLELVWSLFTPPTFSQTIFDAAQLLKKRCILGITFVAILFAQNINENHFSSYHTLLE